MHRSIMMNLDNERWANVPIDSPSVELYISTLGRAKTVSTSDGEERILNPCDNGRGYKYICVRIGEKRKHLYMHRLVAEAFIPKPDGKDFINHIDYDKGNNKVDNLEWCTVSENVRWSIHMIKRPRPGARTSEYGKGIRFVKGKFCVGVYHDKKQFYVGRFETLEEARNARNKKYAELGFENIDFA